MEFTNHIQNEFNPTQPVPFSKWVELGQSVFFILVFIFFMSKFLFLLLSTKIYSCTFIGVSEVKYLCFKYLPFKVHWLWWMYLMFQTFGCFNGLISGHYDYVWRGHPFITHFLFFKIMVGQANPTKLQTT